MRLVDEEIAALYSWITGVARRLAGDTARGDDLAHDTILKALCAAGRIDSGRDMKPYLMAIMVNTLRSRWRHHSCLTICPLMGEWASGVFDMEMREEQRSVLTAISRLAKSDERVRSLWLYAMGYDYSEIAAMTCVSVGTVKSRLHYSRQRLKRLFKAQMSVKVKV